MSIDNNLWRQLSKWGKGLIIILLLLSIFGNTFLTYREQILGIQPGQEDFWAILTIISLAVIQIVTAVIFILMKPSDEHSKNEVRSYLAIGIRRESNINLEIGRASCRERV